MGRKGPERKSLLSSLKGGRAPGQPDVVPLEEPEEDEVEVPREPSSKPAEAAQDPPRKKKAKWKPYTPCAPSEARLTVIQITDVYTLEHLASVKTMVADVKARCKGCKVISMLTGDFLAPYLLSSVDRGNGMMNALRSIPIDYLTWGNHEADINHKTVCRHVREWTGTWINSNMLDHEAMDHQVEYEVVEIGSPDGTNSRKVGMIAVLDGDPALYKQFKAPGAFGGAIQTIKDPWETLAKYKPLLEGPEHNVDQILPLQHLYVPDDHKTCRMFDFPVILSGHDHHRVDQVVEGTRLLKPGMDAMYATILEMAWPDRHHAKRPVVNATMVKTANWEPEPVLQEQNIRAYDVLAPLRNTELSRVDKMFEPLSSAGARGRVCTMGKFVCTLIRQSLNSTARQRQHLADGVLLMGGNIRGGTDYPLGSFFSLEALEAEIKPDEVVAMVPMPGWLMSKGVGETHSGDPIPGWMQYDEGIVEDESTKPSTITHVLGKPIEPDRIYHVATKISDLTNGQCPSWTAYYKAHPEFLPRKGNYVNIHAELMQYFAKTLWRRIWDGISVSLLKKGIGTLDLNNEGDMEQRWDMLDSDHDGVVTVEGIQKALAEHAGYSVDDRELTLAKFIHDYANTTGGPNVTQEDLMEFMAHMDDAYERDKWRTAYPKMHRRTAPSELVTAMAREASDEDLVDLMRRASDFPPRGASDFPQAAVAQDDEDDTALDFGVDYGARSL